MIYIAVVVVFWHRVPENDSLVHMYRQYIYIWAFRHHNRDELLLFSRQLLLKRLLLCGVHSSLTEAVIFFWFLFFTRQMYLLLTSLVSVVLASCIPFMGNDPHNFQGRDIIVHLLCQTVREEMAIVDTRVVFFFGWIAPFSLHVRESLL